MRRVLTSYTKDLSHGDWIFPGATEKKGDGAGGVRAFHMVLAGAALQLRCGNQLEESCS